MRWADRGADQRAEAWATRLSAGLEPLLAEFLPRQRWFPGDRGVDHVTITSLDLHHEDPLLLWVVFDVGLVGRENDTLGPGAHGEAGQPAQPGESGRSDQPVDVATYQLVLGGRPADTHEKFLEGKDRVTLGVLDGLMLYDALVDPDLALRVLTVVAPGEHAEVARPLLVEQSNTSVVYDERLILKLFRRLHPGPNPDVEITRVLGERGFPHVVPPRAEFRRDGVDLAVVRDYLLGATDAWQLAHTSLRDLLGSRLPPEEAGGDFAADAATLGTVTAALHVALADAFGTQPAEPLAWLETMHAQVNRMPAISIDRDKVAAALDDIMVPLVSGYSGEQSGTQLSTQNGIAANAGLSIRIHGDLHLGQTLRSDTGWFVLDFEGEPARPVSERRRPSSPLRDVAGMFRSFHYAARTVLAERGRDVDLELPKLSEAWEERAREAFWGGYLSVDEVSALLPAGDESRQSLRRAFELDKAVYEVIYESKHRPSWVDIPASALERMINPKG